MVVYDKKNKAPPVQMPIAFDGNCLKIVSSQQVEGIIIDEELSFSPYVENVTQKSKQAYVMHCAIWYQSLFGACMFVWMHANACYHFFLPSCCFYLFAWVSMAFEQVYQMSNVWMLLPDFIVSWELQCNVSLHCVSHVPWNTFICSVVQCFH